MFGPQHLKHIITYFDGVDKALSQRMLRKRPDDELTLTNELCALLDAETQADEGSLDYSLDQLNADLAALGDGLDFDVTLNTHPHNAAMERHVSQSDLGIVLAYGNRILPEESWSTAYLIQAKRLFRNHISREYDRQASFQAVDTQQQLRLDRLAGILGADALRYGLYCAPTPALPDEIRTQVRALHTRNLGRQLFDGASGLALRDILNTRNGIDSGIWLQSINIKPTKLLALHNEAFRQSLPFTWFIIDHFCRNSLYGSFLSIAPYRMAEQREDNDRVKRIVTGDLQAIQELITELMEAGEDRKAPDNITVLPRHTITITVSVGRSLSPDTALARFQ